MGKALKKALGFIAAIGLIVAGAILRSPQLIKLGVGLAITQVAGLFSKNQHAGEGFGDQLQLRKDPIAPRLVAYGKTGTGGNLVYQEGFGENNETLSTVIAVAGHEITSLEKFKWGGEVVSFTNNNANGNFHDHMFLYEHMGSDDQTADSDLVSLSSKWTNDHRLRGIAYFHLKLVFDREKFDKGFLDPVFIFKGRKVYDPRKDSTNGGSGAHRLNDETTWEWSDNSALCTADYLKGIKVGGTLIAGMGIADSRIDWDNVIAEANVCDETVSLKGGGTEKRYTCNGFIDPRQNHRRNLEQLVSSMAGTVVFQAGTWRIYAGTPRPALKTRTVDDVFGAVSLQAKRGISEKVNSIRGIYADVNEDFQPKDYPPRQNQTYIDEDGGFELWLDVDLTMTTSPTMVQRIAKINLERARKERILDLMFFPVALQDQAMDAVNFSYPPFNITNEKFLIADWALRFTADENDNLGFLIKETLVEIDDAVYDWDPNTDEIDIPATGKAPAGKRVNNQRALPPVNVSGGIVAVAQNPLSAVDAGSTARIDIAQHNRQYGFGSVTYNSGSISSLAFETKYYVYADDPLLKGGSVTYLSSTSKTDVTDGNDRIYIGEITTPANGGSGTTGSGGGGTVGVATVE